MDSFFGTPWADLDLEAVERFLVEDAEAEGLTWEAKGSDPRGGDPPHRDAVRKHVSAFANSELGGFYLLGAAREQRSAGPWKLDPLDFDGEEPTTWLSRVIRNGVNPVPPHDIREWERDGLHVAVVRVDPVAEPPCMTMSGEVFMRVSGESIRVTDAATLRRLYVRGEERVDRAIRNARYAAKPESEYRLPGLGFEMGPWGVQAVTEPAELRIRVAFAPVGVDPTTETRVLRRSFGDRVVEAARALPAAPLFAEPGYDQFRIDMTRDSITVAEVSETNPQQWEIVVETDATVTVRLTIAANPDDAHLLARAVLDDALRPAMQTATKLADDVGGAGRGFLVISVVGRDFELLDERGRRGDVPGIPDGMIAAVGTGPREYRDGIEAWLEVGADPPHDLLAAMERELLRACGIAAWEPEPAPDALEEQAGEG